MTSRRGRSSSGQGREWLCRSAGGRAGVVATFAGGTVTIRSDTRAAVDVVTDTATFTSGIAMRDAHVKSADFLDASRHPDPRSSA
ncbi:MAG: YceI family protein [Tetrasphaera sp.]|nr:YceI family protein [Tetrasphaera sp.]